MPLTTTEAQEVADLITDISVSQYMLESNDLTTGKRYLHLARRMEATIALSDKFGIDLPALNHCRKKHESYRQRALDLINKEVSQ